MSDGPQALAVDISGATIRMGSGSLLKAVRFTRCRFEVQPHPEDPDGASS